MFLSFAQQAYRLLHQIEPTISVHIGSYPEESPTTHLYEFTTGENVTYWRVDVNESSLTSGEVKSKEEVAAIKQLQNNNGKIEEVEKL